MGNQDDQILVPITTAMARLSRSRTGSGNVISQISVQVADPEQMDAAIAADRRGAARAPQHPV